MATLSAGTSIRAQYGPEERVGYAKRCDNRWYSWRADWHETTRWDRVGGETERWTDRDDRNVPSFHIGPVTRRKRLGDFHCDSCGSDWHDTISACLQRSYGNPFDQS